MSAEAIFASVVRWLFPVRRAGESVIHYVPRSADLRFEHAARALCGARGVPDKYRRPRWEDARRSSARICIECHAASCENVGGVAFRVAWR